MSKFKILSVERHRRLFIMLYQVTAQDLETKFTVVAGFDGIPTETRLIEGLEYELSVLKRKDAFWKLPGKVVEGVTIE
jgi:hypothetical protein